MKRWLCYIAFLFVALACIPDVGTIALDEFDPSLEGKPVTVTFSLPNVRIAPSTKSLENGEGDIGGEPYLDPDKLFLVVCGGTQSIKYIRKAEMEVDPVTHEPVTEVVGVDRVPDYPLTEGDQTVTLYQFKVQLELSGE